MSCFARDVTERNRMERELVQADRLSTIGKVAAGLAHEINNPIGIIRFNADILADAGLGEPFAGFVEAIRENAVRAGKTTRSLLSAARPVSFTPVRIDFTQVVDGALGLMGGKLDDVQVEVQGGDARFEVLGDRELLQQVVVNLLLNAVEMMDDRGEKRILIRLCRKTSSSVARILIRDFGPGIPPKMLGRIFDPFVSVGKRGGGARPVHLSTDRGAARRGAVYGAARRKGGAVFYRTSKDVILNAENTLCR